MGTATGTPIKSTAERIICAASMYYTIITVRSALCLTLSSKTAYTKTIALTVSTGAIEVKKQLHMLMLLLERAPKTWRSHLKKTLDMMMS